MGEARNYFRIDIQMTFRSLVLDACAAEGWSPFLLSDCRCVFTFRIADSEAVEVQLAHYDAIIRMTTQTSISFAHQEDMPRTIRQSIRTESWPGRGIEWLLTMQDSRLSLSLQSASTFESTTARSLVIDLQSLVAECIALNRSIHATSTSIGLQGEFLKGFVGGAAKKAGAATVAALLGALSTIAGSG